MTGWWATYRRRRDCLHGQPGGASYVQQWGPANGRRRTLVCRIKLGGCGRRWDL